MASVYELARTLGEELKSTPQVVALMEAKEAYENDSFISGEVEAYSKMHQEYQEKMQAGLISEEEQAQTVQELGEKGQLIQANKLASDLFTAEMNFNNFMNSVFTIVTSTLSGEEAPEAGCNPSSCASCGGGCH